METGDIIKIVLVGGVLYVAGQYVASQPQRVQQETEANREIMVQGSGKAYATPNVAKYTIAIFTGPQTSAELALKKLSELSASVVEAVKQQEIDEKDIATTNLSINPQYDFASGRQILRGFEASQSLELTIRDLDKIGTVLGVATGEGVNASGGLVFQTDDIEQVRLMAQQEAIEDAKRKAKVLAKSLGVELGRVKSFSAQDVGPGPLPLYDKSLESVGGGSAVPQVPTGTQEIRMGVTVTYELR